MARISDEEMAKRVEELVLRTIEEDSLHLPALPVVATRCLEYLSRPDFSTKEVASLIESDPLVAARVVRLANSAARATLEPARSVLQAVMRLGADELQTLLFEVSAQPVFESHDRTISNLGHTLWMHSVAVAMLARAVVRRVGGLQPEAAYLGGLLHDIGKPLVATMLLDAERRLFNVRTRTWLFPQAWLGLIDRVHRRVGIALAVAWRLPAVVVGSIRDAGKYDARSPANPANAVRLANALCKSSGLYAGEFDAPENDAMILVGRKLLSLAERDVEGLVEGLRERVADRLT